MGKDRNGRRGSGGGVDRPSLLLELVKVTCHDSRFDRRGHLDPRIDRVQTRPNALTEVWLNQWSTFDRVRIDTVLTGRLCKKIDSI